MQAHAGLAANQGRATLDAAIDLRPAGVPGARLALVLDAVDTNAGMAGMLSRIHPIFAVAERGGVDATLAGVLGLRLELSYGVALPLTGESAWVLDAVRGTGHLQMQHLSLSSSPLLGDMLRAVGRSTSRELELEPIDFSVQDGRLAYARPWTWTVSRVPTTFTGTLGLDQSLDLRWNIPVTEALAQRHDALERLQGEVLAVPIGGSIRAPRLGWDALVAELARSAARRKLEEELGGLGGILGVGGETPGTPVLDPEALLEQADTLWNEGRKAESVPLYRRLREEFRLTLTYLLNKDRIKDRSRWRPPQG